MAGPARTLDALSDAIKGDVNRISDPGNAGTIQEIFQDATQNHYEVFGAPSPMVLFGVEHWTERYAVWPVLQALSTDRAYASLITLTDDEGDVVERITSAAGARRPVA